MTNTITNNNPLHVISHAGGLNDPTEKPKPGGVVSFVGGLFYNPALHGKIKLWFLEKKDLFLKVQDHTGTRNIEQIDESLFHDHYGFANEVPWFALHELWTYVKTSQAKYRQYVAFLNRIAHLIATNTEEDAPNYFVNDYQMALLPLYLRKLKPQARIALFWHIPFMSSVPENMTRVADPMREIVKGMLGATTIGFHTNLWRKNFFDYVENSFGKEFVIDRNRSMILLRGTGEFVSKVVVAPLGIDYERWASDANSAPMPIINENVNLAGRRYAITVGRCEPIKGIFEQLCIIKRFFEKYGNDGPHGKGWIGRFSFALVAQRTREGLFPYDQYFFACNMLHELINTALKTTTWAPIYWLTESFVPDQLKALFKRSELYICNSLADGLNLTVLEWLAANSGSGVALITAQTGAHELLKDFVVTLNPYDIERSADQIHETLLMEDEKRRALCVTAHAHLKTRTMVNWWIDWGGAAGFIAEEERVIA
jgi:trehalose 6-phosphate synthase